ncbi:hypothetical protein Slin15195_G069420 [Septoria linicola]|uniref:ABM domain-containing protein n=1 Tax=Septoria linicola TaxID=215465 RepID=A0A9Q9AWZ3_9PEZI|nr:hypothetical protein Slin15195_G069420 [Septoria linicola]
MPTTEIAGFPLIDGVTMDSIADDPNSEAALRIKEWSDEIVRQKGYHATSYGTIAESPSDLVAVIIWDSMEAHISTLRQPDYKAVAESISSIFTGAGYMYHVDLEPHDEVQRAMDAPVMEIALFNFDHEPPGGCLEIFQAFRKAAGKESGATPIASAVGITHEEVEFGDIKGNAVVLVVGWESIEAHQAFRDSGTYKKYMPQLMKEVEKVQIHHVALRKV